MSKKTTTKKKLVDLTKDELVASFCTALNRRGYIPLLILIPDREVLPEEFARANFSVYGSIRDTSLQVHIFREVADKIEASYETGQTPADKSPLLGMN